MINEKEIIELITKSVLEVLKDDKTEDKGIRVGISMRHAHLSREDIDRLFGKGYQLTKFRDLMAGDFAANERITIIGPKLHAIEKVRILGPARGMTQVEISRTDAYTLGVDPPVRASGDLKGSSPIILVGPKGAINLSEGCIIANRHIHLTPDAAALYGVKDNDHVKVKVEGVKAAILDAVQIRVRPEFKCEMHIDSDDANACGLFSGDKITIIKSR